MFIASKINPLIVRFHFMAISDDRQRIMPMPRDRINGQPLAYPEAVLLTNPTNPQLGGDVLL
jgi:rhamnogalacturonan endolyase